jgi:hypothetical protein
VLAAAGLPGNGEGASCHTVHNGSALDGTPCLQFLWSHAYDVWLLLQACQASNQGPRATPCTTDIDIWPFTPAVVANSCLTCACCCRLARRLRRGPRPHRTQWQCTGRHPMLAMCNFVGPMLPICGCCCRLARRLTKPPPPPPHTPYTIVTIAYTATHASSSYGLTLPICACCCRPARRLRRGPLPHPTQWRCIGQPPMSAGLVDSFFQSVLAAAGLPGD